MKTLIREVKFVYMCGFNEGGCFFGSEGFSSLDCDLIVNWWKAPIYAVGFAYGKINKIIYY